MFFTFVFSNFRLLISSVTIVFLNYSPKIPNAVFLVPNLNFSDNSFDKFESVD